MKWMLDTDTCIALIKGQPDSALKKMRGKSMGQVGISSIVLSELSYGVAKSAHPQQNLAALREFVMALEVAPYDDTCAMQYGVARAALERKGEPIGSLDNLIAAHALSLDVVLVTHNVREFSRVPGLRAEDWLK